MTHKLVRERIGDDDYYIDIAFTRLDEGLNEDVRSVLDKISDKGRALSNLVKRFNEASGQVSKKRLAVIIVALMAATYGGGRAINSMRNDDAIQQSIADTIANDETTSVEKIAHYFNHLFGKEEPAKEKTKEPVINFKDAESLTTSKIAKDTIKHHEKLVLKGYTIKTKVRGKIKTDGKVTIGWGHAEPIKTSKYKVGQRITRQTAEMLFDTDVKRAEDGVKRIFSQWKEAGNDVKITQGMFDAMVSMAFNVGITGLRTSRFIRLIKDGKFKEAGKNIIGVRNTGRFKGLASRRQTEHGMFHKDLSANK